MTFEKDEASNVCSKEKEDAFEEFLKSKFKELEKDYDGLPKILKEIHGTKSKENTE